MTRNGASLLGFAAAPLSAGVANVVLSFVENGSPNGPMDLVGAFVMAFFFSLPVVLVAMPIYFLLSRFRLVNPWTCLASGALLGGIFGAVLRLPNPPQSGDVLVMAAIGVVAAFVFWLVLCAAQTAER
jgi:ABC-type branched-subunit amino acid transport system permease subunit